MPTFDLQRITAIEGQQAFYQLIIDDKPSLDLYEAGLEKKYRKNLIQLYHTMEKIANNEHVPGGKFHELTGRLKNDPYKEYVFKHGDLRIYAVKAMIGKIIILAGFKNRQPEDIRRMRSLKKQYFESLQSKRNETN